MRALAAVRVRGRQCTRWAARRFDDDEYFRQVELPECTSFDPSECILRGASELPWGKTPGEAIRSLLQGVDRRHWPKQVTVRPFNFEGPTAAINDAKAEKELLSPFDPSPLWEEIRQLAGEGRVGLIHLMQQRQVIVPTLAMVASGATLEWEKGTLESTFVPDLAFETEGFAS